MSDTKYLETVFRKLLPEGQLRRIPKNPEHRDVILATLSLPLARRYPYTEPELNDALRESLGTMNAIVDHVTARRFLVDLGFVKRDAAGYRYFLNYLRQQEVLPGSLSEAAPELVDDAIRTASRKRHRKQ